MSDRIRRLTTQHRRDTMRRRRRGLRARAPARTARHRGAAHPREPGPRSTGRGTSPARCSVCTCSASPSRSRSRRPARRGDRWIVVGEVFAALLDGSVRDPGRIGETLGVAVPLLLVALGDDRVEPCRSGQHRSGRTAVPRAPLSLPTSGPSSVVAVRWSSWPLLVASASAAPSGRASPPLLKYTPQRARGAHDPAAGHDRCPARRVRAEEPVAAARTRRGPCQPTADQPAARRATPASRSITWFGNEFPISVFFALAAGRSRRRVALARTVWGFRLRMLGHNPRTAQRAGVGAARYGGAALSSPAASPVSPAA